MKLKLSSILTSVVLTFGVIIIFLINFTQREITNSYNNNQPFIQVSDNLKYKTTVGHLWFEEFMAGDHSIDPDKDVIAKFESSSKILTGILDGSDTELGRFQKIEDAQIKAIIRKSLEELDELKKYSKQRWENKIMRDNTSIDTTKAFLTQTGEQAGGDLDIRFDAAFEKTQLSLDELKKLVQQKVEKDVAAVQTLSIFVTCLLAAIFLAMAFTIYKFQKENEKITGEQAARLEKDKIKIEKMTAFADHIGQGNYEHALEVDEQESDSLAKALTNMKDKLKDVSEEDKKRNWVNVGFTKLSEIIRNSNDTPDAFYFNMISFLVQYLEANQGGLFTVNNDNTKDVFIELKACLAYEKKKFIQKRIEIEEGLVGRCMQEAASIYMTQIPENYMTITSGLGEANPRSLLLVPLKVSNEIFGVLEVASFNLFEKYQIEFVERIAESIASAISGVKINERTKILLEKAQQQAEELRAQEEEMRQNMEELAATQEEMLRKEREYVQMIEELKQRLKSEN